MLELDDDSVRTSIYRRCGYSEGFVMGFLSARRSEWIRLKRYGRLNEYYVQHPDEKMTEKNEGHIEYYKWATTIGYSKNAARNLDGLRFLSKYERLDEKAFVARVLKESEFWHVFRMPK